MNLNVANAQGIAERLLFFVEGLKEENEQKLKNIASSALSGKKAKERLAQRVLEYRTTKQIINAINEGVIKDGNG